MKPAFAALLKYGVALLCLFLIYRVIAQLGPEKVWTAARQANPWWLLLGFIPLIGRFFVWSWKWFRMCRRQHAFSFGLLFRLVLAGSFLNLVTPTAKLGGGFFRAMILRKKTGWSVPGAYGWVMADQVTNFLGNVFLFGVVLLSAMMLFLGEETGWSLLGSGLLCWGLVGGWLWTRPRLWRWILAPGSGQFLKKWIPKKFRGNPKPGKRKWSRALFEPLLAVGTRHQVFWNDILLSTCSFGLFCWSNALILKALGATASLAIVALVVMSGYLAGTALGIMGGIGVTELFLIKLYTMAGIPGEVATAGALLHRGMFYAFQLLAGGWAFWYESWRLGRLPTEAT